MGRFDDREKELEDNELNDYEMDYIFAELSRLGAQNKKIIQMLDTLINMNEANKLLNNKNISN